MSNLKMSWNTESGRLVCRWIDSKEGQKSDTVSMPIERSVVLAPKLTKPTSDEVFRLARVA